MTSFVYYKFKSQRDESKVAFNGTGISVADLKREIMTAKGLDKAPDVDIVLLDPKSDEGYSDDYIVPRSSSVVVKRTPKIGGGRGRRPQGNQGMAPPPAARPPPPSYTLHHGPMTKRFDTKDESKPASTSTKLGSNTIQDDEAAALEAMFAAEQENWNAIQERMSQAQRVHTAPRFGNRRGSAPGSGSHRGSGDNHAQSSRFHPYSDRPIPQGYVCYRCGQKGHWIQDCPTNKDRDLDGKPRLKRTTGIPRSFLKVVDNPDSSSGAGVMITPEGKLVVAQPDSASWEKQLTARPKGLTEADIRERPLADKTLGCPICSNLFRDAVRTPCCSKTFCEECIQTHLLENEFTCPNCRKNIASVDRLVMDKPMRTRVMDHIDKQIAESSVEDSSKGVKRDRSPTEDGPGEAEAVFDQQPGGPSEAPRAGEPDAQGRYSENQTFEQLQAEINQLQTMLSNPKLPMHIRNSASMQLMQKQTLLNQAQTMSTFISQAQQAAAMEAAMTQAMYNQANMNYGNQQGNPAAWINPDTQINQSHVDSPYQRLPINQRKKYMRRDRPSDFVEVPQQYYM